MSAGQAIPNGTPLDGDSRVAVNDSICKSIKKDGMTDFISTFQKEFAKCKLIPSNITANYYIAFAVHIPLDLRKPIAVSEFNWDPLKDRYYKIASLLGLSATQLNNLDLNFGKHGVSQTNVVPFDTIDIQHDSVCEIAVPKLNWGYCTKEIKSLSDFNYRATVLTHFLGIIEPTREAEEQEGVDGGGCFGCFGKKNRNKVQDAPLKLGNMELDCGVHPFLNCDVVLVTNGGAGNAMINAIYKTDQLVQPTRPPGKLVPPSMPMGGTGVLMQELGGVTRVREALREVFGQYDNDGDGHIDEEELFAMMLEMHMIAEQSSAEDGSGVVVPDQSVAASVMRSLDVNRNGTLEEEEFENWMVKGIGQSTKALKHFKSLGAQYAQLHNFLICTVQQIRLKVGASEEQVAKIDQQIEQFLKIEEGSTEKSADVSEDILEESTDWEKENVIRYQEYSTKTNSTG
jgi:hypothetical protein